MATECHTGSGFRFQPKLAVNFDGGEITSEAGLVLVREFDERLGLTRDLRDIVRDNRDQRYVTHGVLDLLRQRIYQIVAGYEDTNDATLLRNDPTMRAVVHRGGDAPLASQPTLSRLENDSSWETIRDLQHVGMRWFSQHGVAREKRRPEEVILDIDSTEDPTHGHQQLSFFNGYYDSYMYHPLLVFEGTSGVLLASRLRPGDVGGIRGLVPLLRPVVSKLRDRFPRTAIALRADGDFSKEGLLDFAERACCLYAFGLPRNVKLQARIEGLRKKAEERWKRSGEPVRLYTSFFYKTQSWSCARRVAAKVEYTREGYNPRFVVTNRCEPAQEVFAWYNQRGQAENFIKEFKRDLCADRLSCSSYRANAFRLQLHAVGYNLLVLFRRAVLVGTELARATVDQLRLRLFKVGARVKRTVRQLWFHLASGWPGQPLFVHAFGVLATIRGPT